MNKPLILGITGGVGSGKTEFSNGLRRLRVLVIDADEISRELVKENIEIRQKLKMVFGDSIFTHTGELKRDVLGRKVSADQAALDRLNQIMQVPLNQSIRNKIQFLTKNYSPELIGIDMATLYESGMDKECDKIVVVDAPIEKRFDWLKKTRKWSREEIAGRIQMQLDVDEKKRRADIVLKNEGNIRELRNHAKDIKRNLLEKIESHSTIQKIV